MIFVGRGQIDVRDGAFVVVDELNGERMHIPVGTCVRCVALLADLVSGIVLLAPASK